MVMKPSAFVFGVLLGGTAISPAWAQQATVSSSPPSYSPGQQPGLSQTQWGGLRVQLNLLGTDLGLGRAPMAQSLPVTIASDQPAIPVSGNFSASLSGFAPSGNFTSPLTVTTGGAQTALPSGSPAVVAASNTGSNPAYVNLGTSSSVTATTADILIPAGCTVPLTVGANTNLAGIATGGSTTLNLAGGTGLFAPYCSGGSGGGSGGAVTNAGTFATQDNGTNSTAIAGAAGTTADSAYAGSGTATMIAALKGVYAKLAGTLGISAASLPLPAGASTSAKQPALGSVGSVSTDVLTVQNPSGDPCQTVAKTSVPISQAASAKLLSGTSSKKTYICSFMLVAGDAEDISLVEGTGSICATGTAAVIGGTAAPVGPNFQANGGFSLGNGGNTVASGASTNSDFCLFQSGTGRVAGVLTYVQQ